MDIRTSFLAQIKKDQNLSALISRRQEDLFELESQDFLTPLLPRKVRNSTGQLTERSVSLLEALSTLEGSTDLFFTALMFYLGKEEMSAETYLLLARSFLRERAYSAVEKLTELHLKHFNYQDQILKLPGWKQNLLPPEVISDLYLSAFHGDCLTFGQAHDQLSLEHVYEDLTELLGISLIEVIYIGGSEQLMLCLDDLELLRRRGNDYSLAPLFYYENFNYYFSITPQLIGNGVKFPSEEIYREFPAARPLKIAISKISDERELLETAEKLIEAGTSTKGALLSICRLGKTFLLPTLAANGFGPNVEDLRSLLLKQEYKHFPTEIPLLRRDFIVSAESLLSTLSHFDLLPLARSLPSEEVKIFESDPLVLPRWNLVKELLAASLAPLEKRAASVVRKALMEAYYRPGGKGFFAARSDFEKRLAGRTFSEKK